MMFSDASVTALRYAEDELGFVSYIVGGITGSPDCFDIGRSMDERGVLITLSVDKEHLGRVIGKMGSTAQALRNLLRALGMKNDARYSLLINERGVTDVEALEV